MGKDRTETLPRKIGLKPIAAPQTRLLILGSLPGDASLAAGRYYGHRSNQFWRLVGGVVGEELYALDYDTRLSRLCEARIGLWDVIASAIRRGSLDQDIRHAEASDLDTLVTHLADLRAVAFNGAKAAAIGKRTLRDRTNIAMVSLPSSSAACTMAFVQKAQRWSGLERFLE